MNPASDSLLVLCSFTRDGQKRVEFGSLLIPKEVNKAQNNPSAPGSVTQGEEPGSSDQAELHPPPCCLIKLAERSWHLIWLLPSARARAGTRNSNLRRHAQQTTLHCKTPAKMDSTAFKGCLGDDGEQQSPSLRMRPAPD